MEHSHFTKEQREELKGLVTEAIDEYFKSKGVVGKNIILTTATVIGSLAVIFGGLKAILGWLGFTYIKP